MGRGHHDLMEQNEVSESSKLLDQTDLGTSNFLLSKLYLPIWSMSVLSKIEQL